MRPAAMIWPALTLYMAVPYTPADHCAARWQNGYAEDCKSFYVGSIPARASKDTATIDDLRRGVARFFNEQLIVGFQPGGGEARPPRVS